MSGLILNLKPYETFLVGDLILQNGGKRTQLHVRDENAGVLRLSDALHPEEVRTPVTRAYYAAQLLLLGKAGSDGEALFFELLSQVGDAFGEEGTVSEARRHARAGRFHKVLRSLRPLLPQEALLLSRARYKGAGEALPQDVPETRTLTPA